MSTRRDFIRGGFPSWEAEPLPWLAVAVLLGVVVLGPRVVVASVVWPGVLALLLVAALGGGRRGGRIGMLLAGLCFGAGLGAPVEAPSSPSTGPRIEGVVRRVQGSSAVVDHAEGSVRLWFSDTPPPVGARVLARTRPGRAQPRLPGAPAADRVDQREKRPALRVRDWITLGGTAPKSRRPACFQEARYGGLLWALATGERPDLDPAVVERMRRTGTAHLLAISGLHIGLVAGLVWGLAVLALRLGQKIWSHQRWPVRWTHAAALPGVVAAATYAHLVGWPVSARRAVLMVGVAALARFSGRPVRPWTALALAALVVVVLEPDAVFGLGFGLSFGAVAGILGVTPRLLRWCPPDLPHPLPHVLDGMAVSVGAVVGTLPLTAWWFQSLSPLGPVSNLVAGPLIGGIGVPAALLAAHGPERLAGVAVWVGDQAVHVAMSVLGVLDVPPWAPAVGPWGAVGLALAVLWRRNTVLWMGIVVLVAGGPRLPTRSGLEVTFLSVGQGDAVFVRLPDGRRWLVDGGPPSRRVVEWLRRSGHNHLDAVFLTHPDSDHLGGLEPVVDQLSIGRFVTARPPRPDEATYRRVWLRLFQRGVRIDGPDAVLGETARLLHPAPGWRAAYGAERRPKDNDDSLVLLLEHAGRRILLAGDIEQRAEARVATLVGKVDLVQAPHHGSRSSSTPALVAATDPAWVVISCGLSNPFGHPHIATLTRWRGRRIVRTDRDGTVRVRVTDGGLQVERWDHAWGFEPVAPWRWSPRPPRRVLK